jgi:hypothetical protein
MVVAQIGLWPFSFIHFVLQNKLGVDEKVNLKIAGF